MMPAGTYTVKLDVSIENIWDFVSDMNNWAPLVPGYIEHEIIKENQSTWEFKSDIGIIQKTIKLQIDITEWREPSLVTFNLTGLNEKFAGSGYFEAEKLNANQTIMTGNLDITAKGMIGPMINKVLKKYVPDTAQELTDAIANKMNEINKVNN